MQLLFKIKQALGFCCAKGCWKRSKYTLNLKPIGEERHICEEHFQQFKKIVREAEN